MIIKTTAAFMELRALIDTGEFAGKRIKRLILRATANYPDKVRLVGLLDELNSYLEETVIELLHGSPPFSLPVAMKIIDELEEAERTGKIDPEAIDD